MESSQAGMRLKLVDGADDETAGVVLRLRLGRVEGHGTHSDLRLISTRSDNHASISTSSQPTDRAPSRIGLGKLPWDTAA
jgi:hypothetical protein